MYLIKVELNRRLPQVRKTLSDCQAMHRLITGLFGASRQEAGILYRSNIVQDQLQLYMYSSQPVTRSAQEQYAISQKDISSWLDRMTEGSIRSFDLIASPSKKVIVPEQKNSQRRILREPAERQQWMERKAEQNGFRILSCTELEQIHTAGKHSADNGGTMYHDAYHYQGVLQITDAAAFRNALQRGIGSGKAYGFGMMMVKGL